ncbi:hypothetical protein Ate01nite_65410 [Actinoplanes teichomyceticus]|nr:hypothetical protein Ate01nite_65410 [Actinoplanes teichomyceticus]
MTPDGFFEKAIDDACGTGDRDVRNIRTARDKCYCNRLPGGWNAESREWPVRGRNDS